MDPKTIEHAWKRDRRWVAAILLAHMPGGSELEDLLQEVALTLVRHAGQIRDEDKIRPWLRTAAINTARQAARRRGANRSAQAISLGQLGEDPPDHGPDRAKECNEVHEATQEVVDSLASLAPRDREVLTLRCMQGLSQREIAGILEVPETTVESRLTRARRRLQSIVRKTRTAANRTSHLG